METVTCTINGVRIEVPKGTRIIEAAEQAGIGIAHYCYHPGLSAPAMCRMCLVEVEGAPKLAPACVTTVGPDQVIHTESEKAREARRGTLEFYLANHPLDCPICDKSGECRLQDFVHSEGRAHGRSIEPKRVLGQDDFGGDILYDGDRCIMCTRCVRFTREISQTDALGVVQRGSRSVIDTFFDHGTEGDPFAGNVVDICPVGALLSKDFLHKARVWDLDHTPSVCPSCSQGCNIRMDARDNLIARLKPRTNPDVNSWWMCDYGRRNYEWMNAPDRLDQPLAREGSADATPVPWKDAAITLVERLKAASSTGVVLIGSPYLSNEDNGLLLQVAGALGDTEAIYRSRRADNEVVCPGFPKLARRRDLAANVRGLDVLGFRRAGSDDASGGLPDIAGRILIVAGDALDDAPEGYGSDATLFIALAHHRAPAFAAAHLVLPISTFAECDGTFTNFEGRVQRFWPALDSPAGARPAWQIAAVLLAGLGVGQAPADAGRAFLTLTSLSDAFDGLSYETIGTRGAMLNEPALIDTAGGD
jgi:NADH-quinone oxidoreductase subunit G